MMELFGVSAALLARFTSFGLLIGTLFGFFGMGGSFLVTPALLVMGYEPNVAAGADLLEIVFSGGMGSFLYAQSGAVDLSIVVPLLAGSALGARLGAAATSLVEEDIKVYFGIMLLLGAVAVAVRQFGGVLELPILDETSLAIILGAALLVSAAVSYSAVRELRREAGKRIVA